MTTRPDPDYDYEEATPLATIRQVFPAHLHDRLYLVGGSVRDLLGGRPCGDLDLLATCPAGDLLPLGFRPVAPKSAAPILFRHLPGIGTLEVTLLPEGETLAADLRRRDFTVNAMALDLAGTLHDPLHGRDALARQLLAPCSPTSFSADPLRIFRGFRFEAEGWRFSPDTEALMAARSWEAELGTIPAERFSREMLKALAAPSPARFFRRMHDSGIGATFLPEIFRMAAIPAGPLVYHPEGDLFTHSLEVLERIIPLTHDATARFSALFHDLGKLATDPLRHPSHHGHDLLGADAAGAFCRRLRLPAALGRGLTWACRLHLVAGRWGELRISTRIGLAEDALKGGIAHWLPLLVAADRNRPDPLPGWEQALATARMSARDLELDLAGRPPTEIAALLRERKVMEYRRRTGKEKD